MGPGASKVGCQTSTARPVLTVTVFSMRRMTTVLRSAQFLLSQRPTWLGLRGLRRPIILPTIIAELHWKASVRPSENFHRRIQMLPSQPRSSCPGRHPIGRKGVRSVKLHAYRLTRASWKFLRSGISTVRMHTNHFECSC